MHSFDGTSIEQAPGGIRSDIIDDPLRIRRPYMAIGENVPLLSPRDLTLFSGDHPCRFSPLQAKQLATVALVDSTLERTVCFDLILVGRELVLLLLFRASTTVGA